MTNYHKLVLDLEKIVEGDVLCDHKTLEKYSRDASLFTVRPQIVVYPKDKFDIQAIVKHVNSLKALTTPGGRDDISLSITARAAGTDMSGGPLNDSIILDTTKYMHKIFKKNFVKENFFVECEPGTYFRDLEKILDTYGLMFPSYPASKDLCCLGGMVSNNSSGEKSLLYGSTKDWLEEVEVVLSDGSIHLFKEISFDELDELIQSSTQDILTKRTKVFEIYTNIFNLISENKHLIESEKPKVSKNSSGYYLWECINWDKQTINLAKLICGSQGTLGIVTKTKLKLVNKPKYSQMLTVFLPNLGDLVNIVESILEHKPESIETFDDNTFQIAMKFLPNIIWKLKGNIFNLAFSFLPEAWMALTGGIPKLILMAEFTGFASALWTSVIAGALITFFAGLKLYNQLVRGT
jgi:FAD/FMN-containing dehydrogenase